MRTSAMGGRLSLERGRGTERGSVSELAHFSSPRVNANSATESDLRSRGGRGEPGVEAGEGFSQSHTADQDFRPLALINKHWATSKRSQRSQAGPRCKQ
ncbi:hypothetical protein AAFF_G00001790 [Aldrovandia affinis]|uniref:Uncharacterized protein n=1 Tax=Aldrovandia affinis TaxID=143900 RepID=A0AAD7X3B7_9TELE|nr:hypothetical protein AAFF_G00001790 [Aldrovandia affinis]